MSQTPRSFRSEPVPTVLLGTRRASPAWAEPAPCFEERRAAPRSVALEYRSWLGWWQDEQFTALACRLLDISRGGIAVEIDDVPPPDHEVWFCLHPGEKTDCVTGEVVGCAPGVRARYRLRIAFWEPCPSKVIDVALRGSWN